MKSFTVYRQNNPTAPGEPTFGRMEDAESQQVCVTLELPDLGNAHGISRVPAGAYPAHRYLSPKRGYEVFMLDNVPDRDSIELHIGNTVKDTDGCLLLGTSQGDLDGHGAVLGSADAFGHFMNLCAGEQNILVMIVDAPIVPQDAND